MLINVKTNRLFWHAGAGIDSDSTPDLYKQWLSDENSLIYEQEKKRVSEVWDKMSKSLREIIKAVTRQHLVERNGLAMGQCLTAVGWVGGTLPELYEENGMVEVSMADVAGGGFAVGCCISWTPADVYN